MDLSPSNDETIFVITIPLSFKSFFALSSASTVVNWNGAFNPLKASIKMQSYLLLVEFNI